MAIFQRHNSRIQLIARGLLVRGEEIILCRLKDADWYFLPGGHIEDGESARSALLRELLEETGIKDYEIHSFIGVCENIFPLENDMFQHEINIVFKVSMSREVEIHTKEDHIEFIAIPIKDVGNYNLLPHNLKTSLLEWMEDGQTFFKEL